MRTTFLPIILPVLLGCLCAVASGADPRRPTSIGDNDEDPTFLLDDIEERRGRTVKQALFPVSPLKPVRDLIDRSQSSLYEKARIRWGLNFNQVFQGISRSLNGSDKWGTTSDLDFVGSWDLLNVGQPTLGKLAFGVEGRWDYGTTGPQELGFVNLASAIGTANAFSAYIPTFILRNLYWEQGSAEAGWAYRIGKITPDAILGTSQHITPLTTFLTNGGTGFFSNGYPDSGLGMVGVWYVNDRFRLLGLVSDANADRSNWGDVSEGDLYKAFEAHYNFRPSAERAGFSKATLWHNDGTSDGSAINGSTGKEGWGITLKHEQELTSDGRGLAVIRWGKSFNASAAYEQQAGVHFLLYEPAFIGNISHDVVGTAFNWVQANGDVRDEYDLELFYRFPFFPGLDATVAYQSLWNPAYNPQFDHAHVVSLRFRATF